MIGIEGRKPQRDEGRIPKKKTPKKPKKKQNNPQQDTPQKKKKKKEGSGRQDKKDVRRSYVSLPAQPETARETLQGSGSLGWMFVRTVRRVNKVTSTAASWVEGPPQRKKKECKKQNKRRKKKPTKKTTENCQVLISRFTARTEGTGVFAV